MIKDSNPKPLRILVVGCGRMGRTHALSYHRSPHFKIVGLVSRHDGNRQHLAEELLILSQLSSQAASQISNGESSETIPLFDDFIEALQATKPDAVSINTYPDTHAEFALLALSAGAHVFVEKPLALHLDQAHAVLASAQANGKCLVVGHLLQHHPLYDRFLQIASELGRPLVMRMNLLQPSHGEAWELHKTLMESVSPLLDGGVHYADLMYRAVGCSPQSIHANEIRLAEDAPPGRSNYGQWQVTFSDGSLGFFETGWGPMIPRRGPPLREILGPLGSVTLIENYPETPSDADRLSQNKEHKLSTPSQTNNRAIPSISANATLIRRYSETDSHGQRLREDEVMHFSKVPSRQDLCDKQQAFFLAAIRGEVNLSAHHRIVLESLKWVLAADKSAQEGRPVAWPVEFSTPPHPID
jgi:predicted dehydrogenase